MRVDVCSLNDTFDDVAALHDVAPTSVMEAELVVSDRIGPNATTALHAVLLTNDES